MKNHELIGGNSSEGDDTNPMDRFVLNPKDWPEENPSSPWHNYDGPFDGDYVNNTYVDPNKNKIHQEPSGDLYMDDVNREKLVDRSNIYSEKDKDDESRDF